MLVPAVNVRLSAPLCSSAVRECSTIWASGRYWLTQVIHRDIGVRRSCAGRNGADLCRASRLRQHGDRVGSACRNLGRKRGGAGAGGRYGEVVAAVILQHDAAGKSDDLSTDCVRRCAAAAAATGLLQLLEPLMAGAAALELLEAGTAGRIVAAAAAGCDDEAGAERQRGVRARRPDSGAA